MTAGQILVPAIGTAWITFAYTGCHYLYKLADWLRTIRIYRTPKGTR